jgi:hypothetical protein
MKHKVIVTPLIQFPPRRRWFVTLMTNQNLDTVPNQIESKIGDPNTPLTKMLDFHTNETTRRHNAVDPSNAMLIINVDVSAPEQEMAEDNQIRQYAEDADEYFQVYFCTCMSLERLKYHKKITIYCRPRDAEKNYSRVPGLRIDITNTNPIHVMPEKVRENCKRVEMLYEHYSAPLAASIETSAGKKLEKKDWKALRRYEEQSGKRVVPGAAVLANPWLGFNGKDGDTTHTIQIKMDITLSTGNRDQVDDIKDQAKPRTVALPPGNSFQFDVLGMLREYRDSAALNAQLAFVPPNIIVYKPNEEPEPLQEIDMIFYDVNYFHEKPIVCCMLDMGARTNEEFWLNMLWTAEQFMARAGMTFDINSGWVYLLTLFNSAGMSYVLEPTDVFREGWYTRSGDCDEAFQSVQLFQIFTRNTTLFKDPRLIQLQKIARQYYPFCAFWYATTPSANNEGYKYAIKHKRRARGKPEECDSYPVGHMSALFIKIHRFNQMEKNAPAEIVSKYDILIGEGTSTYAPVLDAETPSTTNHYIYADKLAQRSVSSHRFYTRLMAIFTPVLLDSTGLHAFQCYTRGCDVDRLNRRELGVSITDLVQDTGCLGLLPYPALSKQMISLCYILADTRTYCPNFLFKKDGSGRYASGYAPADGCISSNVNEDDRFQLAETKLRKLFQNYGGVIKHKESPVRYGVFQPPIYLPSTQEPPKKRIYKVFTVDDILFSRDAINDVASVLKGCSIAKIDRVALIKMTEIMLVEFVM